MRAQKYAFSLICNTSGAFQKTQTSKKLNFGSILNGIDRNRSWYVGTRTKAETFASRYNVLIVARVPRLSTHRLPLTSNPPLLHRLPYRLRFGVHVQLHVNVGDVFAHGVAAQEHFCGNSFIVQTGHL